MTLDVLRMVKGVKERATRALRDYSKSKEAAKALYAALKEAKRLGQPGIDIDRDDELLVLGLMKLLRDDPRLVATRFKKTFMLAFREDVNASVSQATRDVLAQQGATVVPGEDLLG